MYLALYYQIWDMQKPHGQCSGLWMERVWVKTLTGDIKLCS